jgi:hypothetical protein
MIDWSLLEYYGAIMLPSFLIALIASWIIKKIHVSKKDQRIWALEAEVRRLREENEMLKRGI